MNKPKKILACGDIHVFNSKRFDEHRHVFDNFYKLLDVEKPDIIVITGDVIDSKLRLSPEQIDICRDFFKNLADRAVVIVIPGNHDLNLGNKERLDSLTPIIFSLLDTVKHPIHYWKHSSLYYIYDICWAVWSCIEDQKSPFQDDKQGNEYTIGLYHGVISGATTDDNFKLSGGIDVSEFDQCDMVIASDIHKQQSFRDGDINYTGSFIQVNVTEEPNGSCIIYDLIGNKYKPRIERIKNDYSTFNVNIEDPLSSIPLTTNKIRLKFDTDKMTRTQANEVAKKMRNEHNVKVDLVPIVKKKNLSLIKLDDKTELNSLNVLDYFREFVTKAKDRIGIRNVPADIDRLLEYEKEFSHGDIKDFEMGDYDVYKLIINNFLSFGPNDKTIDLDRDNLLGIIGENRVGKSSIIKAIQFALFNELPNQVMPIKLINKYNRNKPAYVEVYFVKGTKNYKIKRLITPNKRNAIDTVLTFQEIDDNNNVIYDLTKESRPYTETEIRKYLGINEFFEMLSVFSAQKRQTEFIDCKNAERLKLVNKFLGLQGFELRETNVLNTLKEKNAIYNNLVKQFDNEININSLNVELKKNELLLKNAKHEEAENKAEFNTMEFGYKDILTAYNSNLKISQKKIEEPIKLLNKIEELKNESKEIENKIIKNINDGEQISKDIMDLEQKFRDEYHINYDTWKANYDSINEYRQQLAVINHDVNNLNKQLELDVCQGCGKNFTNADKKKVNQKINSFQAQKDEISKKLFDEENKLNDIKEKIKSIINMHNNVDKLINKDNNRLRSCIKDIKIEIGEIQLQISDYDKIKEARHIVSLLKDKVEEYNRLKNDYSKSMSDNQIQIGTYSSRIKEIGNKIKTYNERLILLNAMEDEIRLLKAYRKIVNKDGLPLYILQNKIDEINEKINIIVSQVFDFKLIFFVDDEKGELKIQFNYDDEPDGNDIGLASGSETFIINVCIKVALSQISSLPKIDSFFIDEGYDSLDYKTIEKLPALFDVLTNYYKNVITISHMDTVKEICRHQIKLEKKGRYTEIV